MTLSVGEQLRQAREARKLSLDQVAQATRIRRQYLLALESENFEQIPSPVQARGFLRSYANFLNLDIEPALSEARAAPDLANIPASDEPTPPSATLPHAEQAQAIFSAIGDSLRRHREMLGLSQEDVERHTHLRLRYLTALESGQINDLPSPVQGRGMLSNYANFLGLDPEPLLMRFAEGLQAGLTARQVARASTRPAKTRPLTRRFRMLRSIFSIDLLVGTLLVVFIVGFFIWGALRISSFQQGKQPTVTAPSIADVLAIPTPSLSPSLTTAALETPASNLPTQELLQSTSAQTEIPFAEATQPPVDLLTQTETATLQPFSISAVQIYIVAQQRAWMRIIVDGKEDFSGRVLPGSAYLFTGKNRVEIITGNGAALNIYFNQEDQGPLGIFGEVVDRVYTPQGVLVPTPTITLTSTPSATLPVTSTLTASPTITLAP